jgi:hypothetical protein
LTLYFMFVLKDRFPRHGLRAAQNRSLCRLILNLQLLHSHSSNLFDLICVRQRPHMPFAISVSFSLVSDFDINYTFLPLLFVGSKLDGGIQWTKICLRIYALPYSKSSLASHKKADHLMSASWILLTLFELSLATQNGQITTYISAFPCLDLSLMWPGNQGLCVKSVKLTAIKKGWR